MDSTATEHRRRPLQTATTLCALMLTAGVVCGWAHDVRAAAAGARAGVAPARLSGVWVSRNKLLPEGPAAGFPIELSSTDWTPLSAGNVETLPIETYEHQQAAVEKVIAGNGDVFDYQRTRRKPPPYSAAGLKAVQDRAAARAAAQKQPRNPYDQCLPRNSIGFGLGGALEIFAARDHVGVVAESGMYRAIRLGGVDPGQFTPTYDGISIGRWQGDRLAVTTTGFLGPTAGDWPMSDKARVTDTLWVSPDGRTLNIKTVYEDPVNLKEPVARMTRLDRAKAHYEFLPANCVETVQGAAEYAATFGDTPPK